MNLPAVIAELRELNEEVPQPLRLPTETEVANAEAQLGVKFHPSYRRYLLEASDIVFGALEPAIVIPDAGHLSLVNMVATARDEMRISLCETIASSAYRVSSAGLKICTRWRAICARRRRRISSSLLPLNMLPTMTSIQPWLG